MTPFILTSNTHVLKTTHENYSNKLFYPQSSDLSKILCSALKDALRMLRSRGLNSHQNIFLGVGNSVIGAGVCADNTVKFLFGQSFLGGILVLKIQEIPEIW